MEAEDLESTRTLCEVFDIASRDDSSASFGVEDLSAIHCLDASVSDASVEVSVDEAAAGDTADGIDIDIENKFLSLSEDIAALAAVEKFFFIKLRETATQLRERFLSDPRFSAEIWVAANFSAGRQKLVTYGNYDADDVDILVPTAGVAVPVGRQCLTVGTGIHLASEFLRVGFNIDGFSDEFLRDGFSDVSCAEGFLNNIRNLAAADQGADFSDVSSVASWSSCG